MSENNTKINYDFELFSDSKTAQRKPRYEQEVQIEEKPQKDTKSQEPKRKFPIVAIIAIVLVVVITLGVLLIPSSCADSQSALSQQEQAQNQKSAKETTVEKAKVSAMQYDYDTAIAEVKKLEEYKDDKELQNMVQKWEQEKSTLVEFPHDQVTHVFYHSLIVDPKTAFSTSKGPAYNLVMTTVDEFNAITQSMYDKGYVMVSMHDMVTFDEQGNRVDHKIMLPPDKKAFVLSQDDVNYYHYQDGDGLATKLIIDKDGKVKNEYIDKDGNKLVGDYDVVPLIDSFVEKHPDFSYKGHKGILALTGYNGALGYRTDSVYADKNDPNLDPDQIEFLEKNPDFDYEKERQEAKKVAEALKATGWEFATHTWGHNSVPYMSLDHLKEDSEKWINYVESIVGKTDVMIYPNGSDIAGTENYDSNNERFNYLTSIGIRIYCPVDSTPYWQQKGDNYFRMSRRNLDGYRMWHNPDRLTDLFDPKAVLDKDRPTPVPSMEEVYG